MTDQFILYSYFRSSASYRARISLHYKKLPFLYVPVHLIKDGGEQHKDEYKRLNPQSQVPCLVHHGRPIGQSMAIIQYLEDVCHEPPLFPNIPYDRALVMQICETFNSGLQPFQNLAVLGELEKNWGATPEKKTEWIHHWNHIGLSTVETLLKKTAGDFAYGDKVTAADVFLVPHVFSAKRFNVDLSKYPNITRVNSNALELEAFQLAEPSRQPDYTP
jgi:maleylacetoacetate isomerase